MKMGSETEGGGSGLTFVQGNPQERLRQLLATPLRSLNGHHRIGGQATGDLRTESLAMVKRMLEEKDTTGEGAKLYKEALTDPGKMRSLSALRIQQVSMYLLASLNFASRYFTVVNLGPEDRPLIQEVLEHNEVSYGYVGQDGNARRTKVMPDTTETLLPLRWLNSDVVRYRLQDIYAGDISKAVKATLDTGYDLANKIDGLAYSLLTASLVNGGVFGTFTVTGTKVSRVYIANSRINTANLPTTNDIALAGNSGSTKFRLSAFAAAMHYCDQWAGVFRDGDLRPTGIVLVPSADTTDLASEITPTTTSIAASSVQENLLHGYTRVNYLGVDWTLIPDNTLTSGQAYFQLNKPLGWIYRKPTMDMEMTKQDQWMNYEERFQKSVLGLFIPAQRRMNALRVTYHS